MIVNALRLHALLRSQVALKLLPSPQAVVSTRPSSSCCRYVLEDAGAHALVLIDELGKGTEVKAGTAIAGAMLEQLHNSDCRGAFAT